MAGEPQSTPDRPQIKLEHVDRPDLGETFADSIAAVHFDGQTLRITFGQVQGYTPRDGVVYTPQTTLSGIVAKNTASGEFDAPKAELDAILSNKTAGYVDSRGQHRGRDGHRLL